MTPVDPSSDSYTSSSFDDPIQQSRKAATPRLLIRYYAGTRAPSFGRSMANTITLSSCCAVPGCVACSRSANTTISATSEPPKRAALHCSAAQILMLGGPLESLLFDLCRVLPAELAITSIRVPSTYLRAVFDPTQPAQPSPAQPSPARGTSACIQHAAQSGYIHPRAPAVWRHGGTARRFGGPERGSMTQLLRLASSHAQQHSPPPGQSVTASRLLCLDGTVSMVIMYDCHTHNL